MQKPLHAFSPDPDLNQRSGARRAPGGGSRSYLGAAIGGGLVLAILVFALLFQWNWLRGPLAHLLSARLHRPVTISGNLEVHPWSLTPRASVNGLSIGNPRWAGLGAMARIPRVTVRAKLLPLLWGRTELPLVEFDHPDLRLTSDVAGRSNWKFGASTGTGAGPRFPGLENLVISGGSVRFADARRRIGFVGSLASNEGTRVAGGGLTVVDGAFTLGAADWAGPIPTINAPRVRIEVQALKSLGGTVTIPLAQADHPAIHLVRDIAGRESWNVTGGKPNPFKFPPIHNLVISDGAFSFDDARRKLHLTGVLSSSQKVDAAGRGTFTLDGRGFLNKAPFLALVTGGPLVNVDPTRPYPFNARIDAGSTRLSMVGSIAHPFDFGRVSGRLRISGSDLADLHAMTGLAMPLTPPYEVAGQFARVQSSYAFRGIRGRIGASDIAGELSVDTSRGRPFLKGDLTSRRLRLIDLAAVFGGAPKLTAGQPVSPAQQLMSAKLRAEHRLFPDTRLDVESVRGTDAKVTYRAQSVEAGRLPIRGLSLNLDLNHGLLLIQPVSLTLPQGQLSGLIRLDARGAEPTTAIDLRLADARLETLIGSRAGPPAIDGGLYARAKLTGAGDSLRAAAASANGAFTVVIPHGNMRQALAELLGIDATKGLFLLISKNHGETPIRCAVADFRARDGIMTAQRMVLDTGVVSATGTGRIDLRDETLDLRLDGKPKKFRLVRIAAPITLKGRLESPKVGVDVGRALPQLAISGILGAVAAPLAAILPFVNPGLGKNADCSALLAQASAGPAPPPHTR